MTEKWNNCRVIAHIDMDAFFASVEVLDFPDLAGKPLVVGGDLRRGVVSAASYPAREYGIHSAMPLFQARRLCADLIIRPVRMKRYSQVSGEVMAVLRTFSPLVEQVSVDEAYIDLTGTGRINGPPAAAARSIKRKVLDRTSLTCSVGLSTCKLAAKIASDLDKPDGLTVIPPAGVAEFLESRPIGHIPGVGKKSERALIDIGIKRLGDIKRFSPEFLEEKFGKSGRRLLDIASGKAASAVTPFTEPKSISNEQTLAEDTRDERIIRKHLLLLSNKVGARLRKHGYAGRTVTLKLKGADFRQITRSVTAENPTQFGRVIFREVSGLLAGEIPREGVRLVGVGVSNLEPGGRGGQLGLFDDRSDDYKWERAEAAIDRIADRFGEGAVDRGAFLDDSAED